MATITAITTGEQAVTTTGAVTGSLATATLTGDYTVKVRVRGLTSAQWMHVAIEDTVNATPFSDAIPVAVHTFYGVAEPEGSQFAVRAYEIPGARFGVTLSKFRINVLAVSGTLTAKAICWLEQ